MSVGQLLLGQLLRTNYTGGNLRIFAAAPQIYQLRLNMKYTNILKICLNINYTNWVLLRVGMCKCYGMLLLEHFFRQLVFFLANLHYLNYLAFAPPDPLPTLTSALLCRLQRCISDMYNCLWVSNVDTCNCIVTRVTSFHLIWFNSSQDIFKNFWNYFQIMPWLFGITQWKWNDFVILFH